MANPCLEGRNRPMDTDPGVLGSFPTIENTIRKSYYKSSSARRERAETDLDIPDRYEGDVDV